MQKVYGIIVIRRDGSSFMEWYHDKENAHTALDGEGFIKETLTFPKDLDLEAAGFYFAD